MNMLAQARRLAEKYRIVLPHLTFKLSHTYFELVATRTTIMFSGLTTSVINNYIFEAAHQQRIYLYFFHVYLKIEFHIVHIEFHLMLIEFNFVAN